jgi:hypothetical protein
MSAYVVPSFDGLCRTGSEGGSAHALSEEAASHRLTREYLAEVAPGVDPDRAGFLELCGLLAPQRLLPWLAQHPDQGLVGRFWEEYEADGGGAVVETAIRLARAGHTVTIDYGGGQITLRPGPGRSPDHSPGPPAPRRENRGARRTPPPAARERAAAASRPRGWLPGPARLFRALLARLVRRAGPAAASAAGG